MRTKVIALTGPMLTGKTEALNQIVTILQEEKTQIYHPIPVKFAQPIYDMQKAIYSCARLTEPKKDRKLLQFLGTDWARSINEDIWANIWRQEVRTHFLKHAQNTHVVVITDDCRYPNEAAMVKQMGGVIIAIETPRAVRATRGELIQEDHKSESGIPGALIDHIVWNTGSKNDLYWELKKLITERI